jgi:hypothetical protein
MQTLCGVSKGKNQQEADCQNFDMLRTEFHYYAKLTEEIRKCNNVAFAD